MSLESRYTPYTRTRKAKAAGAMTAPTTSSTTYRGFIQPVSGGERDVSNGLHEQYTHRLYTTVDADVQSGDLVVQGGVTWKVVFAKQTTGISSVNHHKEVLLGYV